MASQKETRGWGWAILLITGGISLAFNIGHATSSPEKPTSHPDTGHVPMPLAVLYGVAPVLVAMLLSHLIALKGGEWWKKLPTIAVFLAALGLSVQSIHAVLEPLAGPLGYVFAGMLDLASLLALNEILSADEETEKTGSQVGSQAGSETLWKPVRGEGAENRPETALGTGSRPALGAPQRTDTGPVPETTNTAAYQRVDRPAPQNGDRPETGSQNRPETGSQTGSQESEKTGSETGQRTDERTGQRTEKKTAETGSQSRAKTAPKTGRRGKAKNREDVIREAYDAYLKENERPISADKLVEQVRAAGHGLSKATALQILADLNDPPRLSAVK